jgi:hypothetical protein
MGRGHVYWNVGDVWLFFRETRAVAGSSQLWVDIADARRVMARGPAIDRGDLVTWSNVTRDELERLAAVTTPDEVDSYRVELDELPSDIGPCSLCYPGNP